jgi:tetratricopeptide (TPR) repeat protein
VAGVAGDVVVGDKITNVAPPAAALALHQIQPPPADFTGRERELAELRAALRAGDASIFVIRGAGGIGKSALALRFAQELAPLYPDAQLYLDMKGASPQPLTTAQAMKHVVRAYHPTAQLPEGEDALEGLYRSVLHGQRALLLMDNAAGREQVEPLIPPAGCALLLTSRFHFILPGVVTQDLDELLREDAQTLLRRIAPRVAEAAAEIADLCGRLPIALRLAGSALAEKPWLTPAEYARRLTDAKERLDLVDASLTLSYDLLNEEQRIRWRQLAVFPGTFDAAGAAAVWEMEIDPARDALGELMNASLVDYESERYRLHDLARVFADSRLSDTEREPARRRHAGHYARVLRAADDLYLRGASMLAGLALFDAEWGNVKAGQAWASSHAAEDTEAARLCSDYPDAGAYCLSLRLHSRERIAWLDVALAAARRIQNRGAEAVHLGSLGNAYAALGEPRRAIEQYKQQLAVSREIGDRRGEGNAFGSLGNAYVFLGEPRRAIEQYEQALVIAREIGDRRVEGNALGNLGLAYADLGEPRRAIEQYEQQLAITRETGDRRVEGNALGNLGLAYADLGEPQRAIERYEQALVIAREISDRRGEGNALGNLGLAYAALGEPRRAIERYEQALVIAREIGDRRGEGNALGNLGNAYAVLREPRRAIEHYEQQLAIAREIGDRRAEASACWNSGVIYALEGDLPRAADLMQVSVDYERSIGHPDAEKRAAQVVGLRALIG